MVFTVGSKMYHPNKYNNHFIATTAATIIFTLAIMAASNMATPAAATTTTSNTTTTYSSDIEMSSQLIYQEHVRDVSETLINQTHAQLIVAGNGTLTLPNSTETIAVNSSGSALVNFETTSVTAQELLTKEDGSENASAIIYEITRHDVNARTEKGVINAIFETNSTGQANVDAAGNTDITLWELETSIPYEKN